MLIITNKRNHTRVTAPKELF